MWRKANYPLQFSYNKTDHPVAFHKSDMFSASKKTIADKGPAPDLEDVIVSGTLDVASVEAHYRRVYL